MLFSLEGLNNLEMKVKRDIGTVGIYIDYDYYDYYCYIYIRLTDKIVVFESVVGAVSARRIV